MSALDITFVEHGEWLKCVAQIANGWATWKNGFGFFGRGVVEYRGDRKISINADLKARPNNQAAAVNEFPVVMEASGQSRFSLFVVKNGKLAFLFPVALALEGIKPTESLVLNDRGTEIRWSENTKFWFELEIFFRIAAPPGRSAPVVREYNTQFWQGGLPSLGKR
jgi:hypothetical protein